ncbi:hypothetical protein OG413_42850 [Streptomyces sp. NBC_01433]|uniref:hypothetical protein n=1 Tax=Streptomyces sp. NBC_01433 TaxID=2903864 RepID=UPI002254158B|nr:hypothetical protein [Streptomyces sp. NBC_01433]MCX4681940.1 hypothetical protein [Streptomyces sp. NBC_01433]
MIRQSNRRLPVDADYLAGIDRDMSRAGLRTLGWTTCDCRPTWYRKLPEPDRLQDLNFVSQYQPIAECLRTALDARPAGK